MSLLTRDCPGGLAIRRSANDRGTAVLGVGGWALRLGLLQSCPRRPRTIRTGRNSV
jgi:hypothetical protein